MDIIYSETCMDFENDFEFIHMKNLKPKHLKKKKITNRYLLVKTY